MFFSKDLLNWYRQYKRDLPWRKTKNPYLIWISEIILQQTRVIQGTSYYIRFIKAFPNLESLARAKEEEVLKLWEGLGYYSRARNLHSSAKKIWEDYKGVFPNHTKELIELKGIGLYSAAAIASICFDEVIAAVDGNVYRVLARCFGIYDEIGTSRAYALFSKLANKLIDPLYPGDFNQAIMELGALVCLPRNPNCSICPLKEYCFAFKEKEIESLPLKKQKKELKKRFFYYILLLSHKGIALKKRISSDIWKGLYELPLIESPHNLTKEEVEELFYKEFSIKPFFLEKHTQKLSHQHLYVEFWKASFKEGIIKEEASFIWTSHFKAYAFPRLIGLFLKNQNFL